jgi:hypothetical protein
MVHSVHHDIERNGIGPHNFSAANTVYGLLGFYKIPFAAIQEGMLRESFAGQAILRIRKHNG